MSNKAGDIKNNEESREWELRGDFATEGIKKMARRTFLELASNIEELIVNAYDADATLVRITINQDKRTITIIDNGNGMNQTDLTTYIVYGKSEKTSSYKSPKFGRSPIGEYGMGGKLAITNICEVCKVVTRKDGEEHTFMMNRAELDRAKYVSDIKSKVSTKTYKDRNPGTELYMEKLFPKHIDVDRLLERFSLKMPISQNFKIIIHTIKSGETLTYEVEEPTFDNEKKFEFEDNLTLVGPVSMTIYYTKAPIPVTKQGIWTKVNGRIVNEKAEWFELSRATSGNRYRYRLYGYGTADGLKDFVTFSKNDFIDCPEYQQYYDFGKKSILEVHNTLLKEDEVAKKVQDREIVKEVEKEVNEVISNLENPDILGNLQAKIKKDYTKEIENAPETPYPDIDKVEEEAVNVSKLVVRGKDKRERRNQSLTPSEKLHYAGKNYIIDTVDLSETGDIVKFTKEKNLIEINEQHPLYIKSSKNGFLQDFVKDIAFTYIAYDYCEGNFVVFDRIYNELNKIFSDKKPA